MCVYTIRKLANLVHINNIIYKSYDLNKFIPEYLKRLNFLDFFSLRFHLTHISPLN